MSEESTKKLKYFYDFGYNKLGPLLLCFSNWLYSELSKNDINKVFFLARDGYIMKRAFDIVNKNSKIKSSYFYASRRAIIVPSLWEINTKNEIFERIVFNKNISLKNFFKKIGLEDKNLDTIIEKYNYKYEDIIEINNREQRFNDMLEDLFPIIKENAKEERNALKEYIKKEHFEGKVAIVDIGWYGSMQKAFESILDEIDIFGYYFGLVPNCKICKEKSYGFLFDTNKNEANYHKLHYFINNFEFLFLAQHGSVKKFTNLGKEVVFYEYEYNNTNEAIWAKVIQDSAIEYIKNHYRDLIPYEETVNKFFKVFLFPKYKDAKFFGDVQFKDDNFKYIAKPQKIYKYVINPKNLKKDFIDSAWRIGFMKKMFIIPLPYCSINNLIRKIFSTKKDDKNGKKQKNFNNNASI